MSVLNKRATIYFEPDIHRVLKIKAALIGKTISQLINSAVKKELREDEKDILTFSERENEPTISFKVLLEDLKASGKFQD